MSSIRSRRSYKRYPETPLVATVGNLGSPDYESAETALNNSSHVTFAHGLGVVPSFVQVILRANQATSQGWVDNEEMQFNAPYQCEQLSTGVDVTMDATNVYVIQSTQIRLLDHSSYGYETITETQYDWVVRAWG